MGDNCRIVLSFATENTKDTEPYNSFIISVSFVFSVAVSYTHLRISLKDKAATDYSLQQPEMYLSKKSIERRKRQGLEIDSTDLPVCKKYVDAIRKKGVHVLVTGKWDNFVTVSCNAMCIRDRW